MILVAVKISFIRILQFSIWLMQSRTIEEALLKFNIPYTMVLADKNSTAVKILAILLLISPLLLIWVTILVLSVLSTSKCGKLVGAQLRKSVIAQICKMSLCWMLLLILCCLVTRVAAQSIWEILHIWFDLRGKLDHLSITELVESVLEKTGYVDILNAQATLESKARVENIEEFLSFTKNFDDTTDVTEEETGLDKLCLVS